MNWVSRLAAWVRELFQEAPETGEDTAVSGAGSAPAAPAHTARPMEAVVCSVREYKDARYAAQSLRDGKVVFILLGDTDEETAQRIIDFVSGAVYLLHGALQMYGNDVVLCTPESVQIRHMDYHQIGLLDLSSLQGGDVWEKS